MIASRIATELANRGDEVIGVNGAEDYAIAIADLLESGDHPRERVGVAW